MLKRSGYEPIDVARASEYIIGRGSGMPPTKLKQHTAYGIGTQSLFLLTAEAFT